MNALFPQISYPFSYGVCPFVEEVNQQALDWARAMDLLPSDEAAQQYHEGKYNWFGARIYPMADREGLFLTNCWFTLFFLLDDVCDRVPVGRKKDHMQGIYRTCMNILLLNKPAPTGKDDGVFAACFYDIWQRFRCRAGPEWQAWYIQEMKNYLEAWIQEAEHFDTGHYFNLQEFMRLRPYFSGGHVCLCMISLATEFHLPRAIYQHKILQELMHLTCALPSWANDLHSLGKELINGDINNMVMLLQKERGISLTSSMDEALSIHQRDLDRFLELERQLPQVDPATDKERRRYVHALRAMISGYHEWVMEDTNRYDATTALMKA